MTQLPNIITLLRIAGSLGLLFCGVTGVVYWIIYALCGISDRALSSEGSFRGLCRNVLICTL